MKLAFDNIYPGFEERDRHIINMAITELGLADITDNILVITSHRSLGGANGQTFHKSMITEFGKKTLEGICTEFNVNFDDIEYIINLRSGPQYPTASFISTTYHELQHVKQLNDGILKYDFEDEILIWDGETVVSGERLKEITLNIPNDRDSYLNLPWEVEAHKIGDFYKNKYKDVATYYDNKIPSLRDLKQLQEIFDILNKLLKR